MAKPRQSRLRRAGLARAREAAGLTQEAFATRAGVEVSTVVRWESGCTTPLPGKRPQIARVLGVGLHDLERLLSPEVPQVQAQTQTQAVGWEGADDGRLAAIAGVREEIAKLTAEYEARPATGLVVPAVGLLGRVETLRECASGGSGDTQLPAIPAETFLDAAELSVSATSSAMSATGARLPAWSTSATASISSIPSMPSMASMPLSTLTPPRPAAPATTPIRWRRDLDVAEAEAALLVGRLLWDAAGRRDSSAAAEFFDRAARRAAQAGDSVLHVTVTLRAAFVGLYGGDPRAGVRRCVQAAVIAAPVSEALFALARLHAAEGHALLGNAAECDRALTTARGAMAAISPDDPSPGACPPRTYQRLAGAAYLALGRHTEARAALTEAAIRYEPGKTLAVVLGHLALACLGEGDTDAALRHVYTSVELAEAAQSVGALAVAFRAGREIVRSSDAAQPGTREVVDRLLAVLGG
ncbi:transcriptional regulator, XRE family [Catenulispora acidiphila DSM 44928]|uniref:Transcriptional regulator, XRE family n=1 Tax=Catenulispora acidiphila (strain DSM 44928 / JCM 14897 / NBRC 102108 / NRRL B-24433 / ID139908) TaxID=479433 RepID=C7Q870_CATAD|nr:helix-turn-helix transcriptional regulator [Catenulispora acidiphila]ACU76058.1 transcriptional regulator, XRE family [Catenulispora acidiphila DSM 44928]